MESNIKLEKTNKILRIIYIILYSIITLFTIGILIHSKITEDPSTNIGFAFTYIIFGIIIGAISYGILLILGLVDLIISAVNKNNPKRKKSAFISSILIISSILTYALIVVIPLAIL